MITEIHVENLAIIESVRLQIGPGFTVLTGETGAGKSLLVDAIELVLGQRADVELVRSGCMKASVQVVFDLSSRAAIIPKLAELGIEPEDNLVYIHREVLAEGRSTARINGRTCPLGTLKLVGTYLVDLHGQHDHQALLDPDRHLNYLDSWIGPEVSRVHEAYILALDSFRKEQSRLRDFRSSVRDREQRLDLLRFQVREIEQVNPQVGEFDALEAELHRLQHAEKLADGVFAALNSAVDAEFNASDLLAASENSLQNLVRWDDSLTSIVEKIHSAQVELQDAIQSLRTYAESLDAEPGRAEEAADRLDAMKRLRRKYGEDETMIRDFLQDAREQLERLEDFEATEEAVAKAERAARKLLVQGAESLTQIRNAYAGTFAELVATQLRELGMERARFAVKRNPKEPDETGADEIRFLFSANAGEELKPLNKIASGGEMSRVMLALKTALAGRAGVPTLIFDEIDAGLGGRAAAIVGRKLTEVAQHTQVMVISHSPQIASCATAHFRIEKVESDGRVITQVNGLTDQARELEIARMLAGEQVTDSALNNARELLAHPA